jgi:hypothetical protein
MGLRFISRYLERRVFRPLIRIIAPKFSLKAEISSIQPTRLRIRIQGVLLHPNLVSVLSMLRWADVVIEVIKGSEKQPGPHIPLPITQIAGLEAANIDTTGGEEYQDFYDFSKKLISNYPYPNRIGFETDDDFHTNIEHLRQWPPYGVENREIYPLIYREWDDKYFILNSDGAHHLAAVYRQCVEQNREFYLDCEIWEIHRIDFEKLERLSDLNYFLIFHRKTARQIYDILQNYGDAKYAVDCSEFETRKAIMSFGKENWKTALAYEVITTTYPKDAFVDLSVYYADLISR